LPNKLRSNSELAIPIIDTTVSIGDFVSFVLPDELKTVINIPAETPVNMGELEYPFFIGDYSPTQIISDIQLFMIVDTIANLPAGAANLPAGTTINLKIYIRDEFGRKIYFWIPENKTIKIENAPIRVSDDKPVQLSEELRASKKVFFDISLTYPSEISVAEAIRGRINIKFAMRFKIETNLIISL
jgi:hypothetical protein